MAVALMTLAAYARHRGCDEKAVRKAVAQNRITAIERDGRKWIDPEVADIQWARNTRARAGAGGAAAKRSEPARPAHDSATEPSSPGDAPAESAAAMLDADVDDAMDYQEAARRLKVEEARLARMERLEREGKLVDAEAVGRAIWTAFRTLRDTAMPLGRRVAGRVATMSDTREIQMLLEAEQRQVLLAFRDRLLAPLVQQHAPAAADDRPTIEQG